MLLQMLLTAVVIIIGLNGLSFRDMYAAMPAANHAFNLSIGFTGFE